ncbi:aspartate/glutamate racemase family protein [Arthrobacter sp. H5]|uniref:aspartate/glutamate racemase family protein n=1 Tax=Arthrobacter sp. H5 TaxID=1267973 RepID=UPI0004B3D7E9|nr:aspartate/glutamate racemase family protein [Arthrobacter sp. H5]
MKLLFINPNISDSVSALILAEAQRAASPGTEIVMRTAPYGVEYIETRMESLLAAGAVAQVIAEEHQTVDAVVVAAFGDPGMPALKEFVDIPVVGITEAALYTAALQGARFSIVAISHRITAWYRECVERNGLGGRLASIRSLTDPLTGIGSVQEDFTPNLLELAGKVVREDGADVVILAGAPLAGLARKVGSHIPVPVVDGISAGVKQAEVLAALNSGPHRAGSFAPPPPKINAGLSEAITLTLARGFETHGKAGAPE